MKNITCGAGRKLMVDMHEVSTGDTGGYTSITVYSADGVSPDPYLPLNAEGILPLCRRCLDRGTSDPDKIRRMSCDVNEYNYK